jgi:hypothetical protein
MRISQVNLNEDLAITGCRYAKANISGSERRYI